MFEHMYNHGLYHQEVFSGNGIVYCGDAVLERSVFARHFNEVDRLKVSMDLTKEVSQVCDFLVAYDIPSVRELTNPVKYGGYICVISHKKEVDDTLKSLLNIEYIELIDYHVDVYGEIALATFRHGAPRIP